MAEIIKRAVLLIDDDPAIRTVVKLQLKSTGVILYDAEDTPGAIKVLNEHRVDAVICDIKLKYVSGFEVFRNIHQLYPSLPFIMLTGYIEQEYYDTAVEMGALDLIIKPVRKEKLLAALNKAFEII